MKRGYFVHNVDEADGIAVVAKSSKDAKLIGWSELMDCEFIEVRVRWQRDADVSKLNYGVVDNSKTALLCGLYSYIEDVCDGCGKTADLSELNGKALCGKCYDEAST